MEEREQRLLETLLQDLDQVFQRTGLPGPCQIPLPEAFQIVLQSSIPPPSSPIDHIERLIPVSAPMNLTAASSHRYPLKPLSVASDDWLPKPEREMTGYLREDYRQIWQGLTDAMAQLRPISQFEPYFFTLYFLLKRFLARVPSSQATDLSMFDHVRVASAIEDCRYLFRKEKERKKASAGVAGGKGTEEQKSSPSENEAERTPEHVGEEKELLLIQGELSGMRRVLFAGDASQQAYPSQVSGLRGRALYVLLLAETLVEYVLRALDLKIVHQMWHSGGQFLILAPNIPAITYHLKACYYDINEFLLKTFRGDLGFALSSLPVSSQMLHTDFGEPYRELQRLLQREQTRPFCSILQEQALVQFPASASEDGGVPEQIGQRLADLDCGNGHLALKVKAATDAWRGDPLVKFEIGKTRHIAWDIAPEDALQIENIYSVNAPEAPLTGQGTLRSGFKLLPIDTDEQAALAPDGVLGVLRIGLDHPEPTNGADCLNSMGSLYSMAAFRADLNLFWTGYLPQLCRTAFPHQICVLSTGRAELCLIGNWRQMIHLACRMYEDWTAFACGNPNLSLFGAMVVCQAQYPVCRAIEHAGLLLDALATENLTGEADLTGQHSTGNALAIFNHRLPWKDLLTLREVGDRFAEAIRKQKMSRRTLHSLLELHRTWKTSKALNTARMYYLTAHTIQNALCRNLLLAQHRYLANPSYIPILVRYVALQTRLTQAEAMSAPDVSTAPDALT